jgi:predicted MFS family arabinose efflux permease
VADIIEPDKRAKASSIGQATMAMAGMVGPPLAAPILFVAGVQWAMLIDAASFGLSFLAIYTMRVPSTAQDSTLAARPGYWAELRAGLSLLTGSRVLIAIVVSSMVANFGAYMLNTLNVFFVTHNLHAKPQLFGLLDTMFGLGAVAGAAIAGVVAQRFGLSKVYWAGLLGTGLLVLIYSRSSVFIAALVILLALAVPLSAMNTVVAPIVMRTVPREALGRVFALMQPAIQVMSVFAIGIAGWLSSSVMRDFHASVAGIQLGTYDVIIGTAGLLISGCGLYAMAALRGSDDVQQEEPAAVPATTTSS